MRTQALLPASVPEKSLLSEAIFGVTRGLTAPLLVDTVSQPQRGPLQTRLSPSRAGSIWPKSAPSKEDNVGGHVFPGGAYPLPKPTSPLLPNGPQEGPSLPSHLVSTRHVCSFSVATLRGLKTWEVGSLTVLTRSTNEDVHGAVLLFWKLWGRTLGLQSCHSRLCLSSHCPPLRVSRSAPVPIRTLVFQS